MEENFTVLKWSSLNKILSRFFHFFACSSEFSIRLMAKKIKIKTLSAVLAESIGHLNAVHEFEGSNPRANVTNLFTAVSYIIS